MYKIIWLLGFLAITFLSYGQEVKISKEDKRLLDSMFKNDEFFKWMKPEKNYLDIGFGITNGAFSNNNNAANATSIDNQLIYSPYLVYRLKNGLSFGINGFFTRDNSSRVSLYQTGLTAGYDYLGKSVYAGISYTRFLSDQHKYNSKSYYQNDFFGYIKRARGVLQPGLQLGFANGKYKEINQVTFTRRIRLPNPPRDTIITISGKDSTDNRLSYFSVSPTVGHDFAFYNVLAKNDELDFEPALLLNMGSDQLTQIHTNKIFDRPAFSSRKRSDYTSDFQIQSIAASVHVLYMFRKFFIDANVYADYYLPETTEKRVTCIFELSAGFSF